jgi:hypothetical protein
MLFLFPDIIWIRFIIQWYIFVGGLLTGDEEDWFFVLFVVVDSVVFTIFFF